MILTASKPSISIEGGSFDRALSIEKWRLRDTSTLLSSACTPETCVLKGGAIGGSGSSVELKPSSSTAFYQTIPIHASNEGREMYVTTWAWTSDTEASSTTAADLVLRLQFFNENDDQLSFEAITAPAVQLEHEKMKFATISTVIPQQTHHVDVELLLNTPNAVYRISEVDVFPATEYLVPLW